MHHERNFWRNHPDKDSVVMALYQKMKQRKEDHARKVQMAKEHSLTGGEPSASSPRHRRPHGKSRTDEDETKSNGSGEISRDTPPTLTFVAAISNVTNISTLAGGAAMVGFKTGFTKNLFKRHMAHHGVDDMHGDGGEFHDSYLQAVSPEGLLVMSRTDGLAHQVDPRLLKKSKSRLDQNGKPELDPDELSLSAELELDDKPEPVDERKTRVKRKCAAALLNMSLKEQVRGVGERVMVLERCSSFAPRAPSPANTSLRSRLADGDTVRLGGRAKVAP